MLFWKHSCEDALKAIEEYLPKECKGLTLELAEQDRPHSMIKLLLNHARVQVEQAVKDFERQPRQKALQVDAR